MGTCQRACFQSESGQPCAVLAMCAQPFQPCSMSGCCSLRSQHCFEANASFAQCLPECSAGLNAFKGWTCTKRSGMSTEEMAAMREQSPVARTGSVAVVRAIMGDNRATALGVTGQHGVALLITALGVLGCCTAYILRRVCHTWTRCWWRHQRLPLNEPVGCKPSVFVSHTRHVYERSCVAAACSERLHLEEGDPDNIDDKSWPSGSAVS